MITGEAETRRLWAAIEKMVEFVGPEKDIGRYLGAQYHIDHGDAKGHRPTTTLKVAMADYSRDAVERFEMETGTTLRRTSSP